MTARNLCRILLLAAVFSGTARGQWRAETYNLQPGWNAIYTFIDASHEPIDQILPESSGITEVWRWQPERTDDRQLANPGEPVTGIEWGYWRRNQPHQSTFDKLLPNYGYLVFLSGSTPRTLSVTGKAVMPDVRWRSDGLHLVGFPVAAGANGPAFSSYMDGSGFALGQGEIFDYVGGPLVNAVNPRSIPSGSRIQRNKAYWIKTSGYSRFNGPIRIELSSGDEIHYGPAGHTYRMVLTNLSGSPRTVEIFSLPSAPAPSGQTPIAGQLSLLAKVDAGTEETPLGAGRALEIPPGGTSMVQLVLDRSALEGPVGSLSASLLRVSVLQSGLRTQDVYFPATAVKSSLAGLWVGEAEVSGVSSVVVRYRRDAEGNTLFDDDTGKPLVEEDLTTPGASGVLPATTEPYTLKLIVHVDSSGRATLLSHIYSGRLSGAPSENPFGLTRFEAALDPSHLATAARLSAAHLPLDTALEFSGRAFAPGGSLSGGPLVLAHNSPVNPFLHAYHPDHDNLDARFSQELPPGRESFNVSRTFSLALDASPPEGVPGSWGNTLLTGKYEERIHGVYKQTLRVDGVFALRKVSDIDSLHTP